MFDKSPHTTACTIAGSPTRRLETRTSILYYADVRSMHSCAASAMGLDRDGVSHLGIS